MTEEKNILTTAELSQRWGVSLQTLMYWRKNGHGPVPFKRGLRKLFYRIEDVQEYEIEKNLLIKE